MGDQAQRIKKNAWAVVFGIWAIGGGALCWNMWKWSPKDPKQERWNSSQSYQPPFQPNQPLSPPQTTPPAQFMSGQPPPPTTALPIPGAVVHVSPMMSVAVEDRPGEGVVAVVMLNNNSTTSLLLPETLTRDPLYKLTLKYGAGGAPPVGELIAKSTMPYTPGVGQAVLFDSERDAAISLQPGSSHMLTIPLKTEYDLKPGKYELTVRFQPVNIFPTGRLANLPNFNAGLAQTSTSFELPLPSAAKPNTEAP